MKLAHRSERYEAIMGETLGSDEARTVQKEVAQAVYTCFPTASVSEHNKTIALHFKLGGAFSDVLTVEIKYFFDQVRLDIK